MQLIHTLRVILKIVRKRKSPVPKVKLILCYARLVLNAYRQHYLPSDSPLFEKIFSYRIRFFNFPELLSLFEEIFIEEIYFVPGHHGRIVDCGSNIGLSILYFKLQNPSAHILAFEPDPANFKLLKENIFANGLDQVFLHDVALGNSEGTTSIYLDSDSKTRSLNVSTINSSSSDRFQNVRLSKLSTFINSNVDLLKIDVEGSEIEIIHDLVKNDKVAYISNAVIEFHPGLTNLPVEDFLSFLVNDGEPRFSCTTKRPDNQGDEILIYVSASLEHASQLGDNQD